MRVSYQPWGASLEELTRAAQAAEAVGAEGIWTPELHRSSIVSVAALAAATNSAFVGTGIALAFARSVMILALEALDLQELSGGRLRLGLGSGTRRMNVDWHGVEFDHPVARMAETIDALRAFWEQSAAGGVIEVVGALRPMRLTGYRRASETPIEAIPIYLAAVGPLMIRLAGRVADGWLSHELCSAAYLSRVVMPELSAGLAESSRGREQIDVTASAVCAVAPDRKTASSMVAGHVGFYAGVRAYAAFFDFHGVGDEHLRIAQQLRDGTAPTDLSASTGMRDALAISGTADDVLERLRAYDGIVDSIKISPPVHGLTNDEIRCAQSRLIGVIAQLRA
jgi:probable F420-dependent oxidoreductase